VFLGSAGALALATVLHLPSSADARTRDTDRDGLSNRFEVRRSHTSPRRADTDRDGLTDRFEVRRSRTNPRRKDTDGDGLTDRFELRRSRTNPRRKDTDGDGLSDRFEWRRSRTNPRRLDTDRDGYPDGLELLLGTDPLKPDPVTPSSPAPSPPQAAVLPHDPAYIGPGYYSRWPNGPSTSPDYFPILAYHMNIGQWSGLPARLRGMGVNGIYMGWDGSNQENFDLAAANGLSILLHGNLGGRANSHVVDAYTMQDEPNADGTRYGPKVGPPYVGADRYAADANAQRQQDPSRPVIGNFTKDVAAWGFPAPGWTKAQHEEHVRRQLNALDITSMDIYGWTDPWEWTQGSGTGTKHIAAWVYGHGIDRLEHFNPRAPAFGFVECCADGNSPPRNTMMPGMIESAVWNMLVHGARGFTYWPRDFYHPDDQTYAGATFTGEYSMFGDHQWDAQYNRAAQVNAQIHANARKLNSPTVAGISASGENGVPVSALGKDDGGKLWLLVQADGNESHPLSNTSPMRGTIQLPSAVAPGTVFHVVGESRTVTVNASHQIVDTFGTTTETPTYSGTPLTYGYEHHIYETAG
jgi:Bacterial TSP3 repeat